MFLLTTIMLTLAMSNGTAMAVVVGDGLSIPPSFPGMVNNCSGLYRYCLPTGDVTLTADNTSGVCTWTYNIAWGDGHSSSFVSRPGITESASHKYINPGIYTIDVTIPAGTSSNPSIWCGPLNQRFVVEVPNYRPDTFINTPPAPSPGSTVNSKDVTFTYASNRNYVTFECSLDGSDFSQCPSQGQTYSDLSEGQHLFKVRARDAGNNEDLSPATRTWKVDTVAPTVNNVSPADAVTGVASNTNVTATFSEAMNSSSISGQTFTLTPQDSSSAVTAMVKYDSTIRQASLDPSSELASNTTYTARVKGGVKDVAGNALEQDYTWTFRTAPDTQAPSTNHTLSAQPNAAGWNNSDLVLTLNATDTGGSDIQEIRYSATGAQSIPESVYDPQNPPLINSEGITTISYFAIDNAGNRETPAKTVTVKLDKTAPQVTPGDVMSNDWRSDPLAEQFSASDSGSGLASSADATFTLTASEESASASQPTVVSRTVLDAAGNSTTRKVSALIDLSAPTLDTDNSDGSDGITPNNRQTGVSRTIAPTATFSDEMDPASLRTSAKLYQWNTLKNVWQRVPATVSLSNGNKKATLDPYGATEGTIEQPLTANKKYKVTITTGAMNLAGLPMASAKSWTFTTR